MLCCWHPSWHTDEGIVDVADLMELDLMGYSVGEQCLKKFIGRRFISSFMTNV